MAKRPRCDTNTAAGEAFAAAATKYPDPPAHCALRPGDHPFWFGIMASRARVSWDDHDLALAANLARSMADLERLQVDLDAEGHVVVNAKGTPVMNPIHSVIEALTRRIVGLSKTLQVHAVAKNGESREQGKRLNKEREARDHLEEADDDLIPRAPTH